MLAAIVFGIAVFATKLVADGATEALIKLTVPIPIEYTTEYTTEYTSE